MIPSMGSVGDAYDNRASPSTSSMPSIILTACTRPSSIGRQRSLSRITELGSDQRNWKVSGEPGHFKMEDTHI